MFTGLIEEVGTIQDIRRGARSCVLTIGCRKVLEGTRIGDSLAVSGVCLTVTSIGSGFCTADVMAETMRRSALGELTRGSLVNLERAMPANGRFGGHIVAGHTDGTGVIESITEEDNAWWYTILAPPELLRYVVEKGSVTVDGISLTVAYVDSRCLKVSVIPHTQKMTALRAKRAGAAVNLECDVIGKYVEKLLGPGAGPGGGEPQKEEGITEEFLKNHGFT